ncbi:hypothetical protein GCM10009868_05900 [Terrabacter aerolatus]|uniref:DUF4385 domain-containing protein n=1 Tax=Terrabacter aerolatus TaxID=422442 RepID=A0A512D0V5_9MICO|nr:DUF4385 domain-containing protein [Terrabacter aerolatus]GEO30097.1 hypothetical protein TAE01_19070 [Terrabacter aerolatus]
MTPDPYAGLDLESLDLRAQPELYRVGRGEQGVLRVQPYKDELLPLWRFRTPDVARESASALRERFDAYVAAGDLVGADMARKFLQMGYTRSRRYANHAGGRKYDGPVPDDQRGRSGSHGRRELPRGPEGPRQSRVGAHLQGGVGRGRAGRGLHRLALPPPVRARLTHGLRGGVADRAMTSSRTTAGSVSRSP